LCVDRRHAPDDGLNGAAVYGAFIELIDANLLSENLRCNGHRQNASQRAGEVADAMACHRHVSSALDRFIFTSS
jgi:hypothetical protein